VSSAGDRNRIEGHLYVVRALMQRDELTIDAALDAVGTLVPESDRQAVIDLWHSQTSTTIQILAPTEISEGGPRPWFEQWDPSAGYYWLRQRAFLSNTLHRGDYEIDSLDRSSDRVLAHLENPAHPEPFNVRGLVVGYVQSGKTANFSALIAKAVDAGYKVVIVLSGLHNTLRRQTQQRLQRDLGHEDTPGVGPPEPAKVWVWMTGAELGGDFNPAGQNAGVLQGNNQVILVVKKNKSRLDRLIGWMANKVPPGVPVLVIDDEADQASVNTGGNRTPIGGGDAEAVDLAEETDLTTDDVDGEFNADEVDPSAINARIRQLLTLFARCSYVAYTATPFANVLIDPNAIDRNAGDDLYPRDFLISLPRPPGSQYVGTERLFGRDMLAGDPEDVPSLDVIEIVPQHEVAMLVPPRRNGGSPEVSPSLQQAVKDFLLSAAARLQRSGRDEPCTMLVHCDMRRAVQDALAEGLAGDLLPSLRQQWKYDEAHALRHELAARWDTRYRPNIAALDIEWDVPFEAIEPYLDRLIEEQIPVRVLNSNHPDEIDFEREPTLKAILVGGNKLSRGVTIEGLLVSFYVRATLYYDTLLQMGRWFGYRGDYVDLTRLYSTQLLVQCFHDLAAAEEDLRRQIALYERNRLTPLQLAPRIMAHPVMLVTAENKMQAAQYVSVSFHGELVQSLRFPFGTRDILDRLEGNLAFTRTMLERLGEPHAQLGPGRFAWDDIGVDFVQEFLNGFWIMRQASMDLPTIREYVQKQTAHGELVRWRVLVAGPQRPNDDLGNEDLGVRGVPLVPLMNRSRLSKDPTSLGVITGPDDELYGLSHADIEDAVDRARIGEFPTRGKAFRSKRSAEEGLLLIYPISGNSRPGANALNRQPLFEDDADKKTLIGLALSFPFSTSPETVEYIQGPESRRS